jgi:Ca-activated chloride channel homolog
MKQRESYCAFGSRHAFLMALFVVFTVFGVLGCGGGGGSSSDGGSNGPPPNILPGTDPLTVNISSIEAGTCPAAPGGSAVVTILLNVLDKQGNQLTDVDLSAANFLVTVDGVAVPASALSVAFNPLLNDILAVSLISDSSGSLSTADLTNIENAQVGFIRGLDASDAAQVIKFKAAVQVMQAYTTDKNALELAAKADFSLNTGPGTWLFSAINQGLADTNVRFEDSKAIIAISDGGVFGDPVGDPPAGTNAVINLAKSFGIPIYTIGLGSNINDDVLRPLAEQTKGIYYKTDLTTALDEVYNSIGTTLVEGWRIQYSQSIQTGNPDSIVVRVTNAAGETGSDTEAVTLCP